MMYTKATFSPHWLCYKLLFLFLIFLGYGCEKSEVNTLIPVLIAECECASDITEVHAQLLELKDRAIKRKMDPQKGINCAEKLLEKIREGSIDPEFEFLVLKLKHDFGINARTEQGLTHSKKAAEDMLVIGNKTGLDNVRANAYSRLHTNYAMRSRDGEVSKKEVEYLLKARMAARASGDTAEILNNLQHAQIMAMKLMDQSRLLELSKETLSLSSPTNPDHQKYKVFAHKHIGYHYYAFEDNYELAQEHLLEGHRLAKEYLAPVHVSILASDLIALYSSNNYPEKLRPFIQDVRIPGQLPFDEAYIAYANKEYQKAEALVSPLLTTKGLVGNKGLILRFHAAEMLRLIHKTQEDYKEALKFSDLKNNLQDSINQISLRSQTEVLLHEEQIKVQEEALIQKDISIRNLILALSIIGMQVFLLMGLFIRLRNRKRSLEEKGQIIQAQNEELNSANQNLESFARVASHDLRSPLRNIHFYSEILEKNLPKLSGDIQEYLQIIRSSVLNLDHLLDDILSYSRAAEKIDQFEPVDLNNLMARILENFETDIQSRGATLDMEILPVVLGHEARIYQVLQNLIGNSLKYQNPDKNPVIHLSGSQTEFSWIVNIQDNCIGIPADRIPDIFQEFTRIHIGADIPGSGLGLSIVLRHMQAHGGSVEVDSKPGEGSHFSLHFPK